MQIHLRIEPSCKGVWEVYILDSLNGDYGFPYNGLSVFSPHLKWKGWSPRERCIFKSLNFEGPFPHPHPHPDQLSQNNDFIVIFHSTLEGK